MANAIERMPKGSAANAERAAEHYAREVLGCVVTRSSHAI